ncbi:hypothetical protein M199_gp227 [Halogranum tailed virus 1]|uniref:C2H2-type domain-containing protein n=1 Tax=Halogranum tailed virus 1 TaxID=1273749 RepID=R4T6X0_9CAUD|nr:hypothetical protein M199_gp227 [Halogranum tailed virus 1]AGM11439.1 hypothetical protein HGTV1_142 [Halogranum tailed virus 1]
MRFTCNVDGCDYGTTLAENIGSHLAEEHPEEITG